MGQMTFKAEDESAQTVPFQAPTANIRSDHAAIPSEGSGMIAATW